MEVETMEGFNSLLRSSCAKIVTGRHRRGGTNIHKNLLILTVITKVQVAKNKLEAMKNQAVVLMETEDHAHHQHVTPDVDVDEEPPLEFSVTDNDEPSEESSNTDEVAFASEAVEESSVGSEERRKRKSDRQQPATPRSKSQRVGERAVPVAKAF